MTRLIDADVIDPRYVPIAPVITGSCTHYEWVVFAEDLEKMPTVDAIPIEYIQKTSKEWARDGYEESAESLDILVSNWVIERKEEWQKQNGLKHTICI